MNDDLPASAMERLERQVERGSLFTHTALSETAERVVEVETVLYGLIDVLMKRGTVSTVEMGTATVQVRTELEASGETVSPGVALRVDAQTDLVSTEVAVNCAERMHVCRGICCKLNFALSQDEVEAGYVRWDLGRPYYIRQERDGRCTHQDRSCHTCGVYANRPAVCKGYSCANDARIWKDFERMELNSEWIAENFAPNVSQLVRARMRHQDALVPPSGEKEAAEEEGPE
jgi:Fe-S-cluster containining protein